MERAAVIELVERIDGVGASCGSRAVLVAATSDVARLRSWLDAREAVVVAGLARVSSFPEKTVSEATGLPLRTAEKLVERAELLSELPLFADALAAGDVRVEQIDALERTMRSLAPDQCSRLDIDRLVLLAEHMNVDVFDAQLKTERDQLRRQDGMEKLARQKQATSMRWRTNTRTGMWHLSGEFDPETALKLKGRLEAMTDRLFHDTVPDTAPPDPLERQAHLRALALVAIVSDPGGGVTMARPEFTAVWDLDAVLPDGSPTVDWGIPIEIPTPVLAALAGTADVHVVVTRNGVALHAPGELNLGRATRIANRAQRRALRALYRTCAIPGCGVRYDHCRLHHVVWWRHGGPTDLDNLLPVCSRHHHNIHDGGWGVELGPNRELRVRLPDGRQLTTGPPSRRAA